jgi:hypothetical protein
LSIQYNICITYTCQLLAANLKTVDIFLWVNHGQNHILERDQLKKIEKQRDSVRIKNQKIKQFHLTGKILFPLIHVTKKYKKADYRQ